MALVQPLAPRASGAPPIKGFSPAGFQTARQTTGYVDPISTAIAQNASAARTVAPTGAQVTKNTTGYTGAGAGTVPSQKTAAVKPQSAPAAQQSPSSPGGPASGGAYDLSTDPIVQKIQQLNQSNYQTAVGQTDASRKQTLIDSGFADLVPAAQFGELEHPTYGDEATALAAGQNPYSTAANLKLANTQAVNGLNQNANDANLWYSTTRANELGDQAHAYLGNVSSAEGQVQSQLGTLLQSLLGERQSEQTNLANAYDQARQNAITNAIASGQVLAGYDQNGNPIFTSLATVNPAAPQGGDQGGVPELPGLGQVTSPIDQAIQGVAANAPGAARANKPGKTVGGYVSGGKIKT